MANATCKYEDVEKARCCRLVAKPAWLFNGVRGEDIKGWLRVSDHTEDGHVILSVLWRFPFVAEQRMEQEEPRKKRKKEETSVDESSTDLLK